VSVAPHSIFSLALSVLLSLLLSEVMAVVVEAFLPKSFLVRDFHCEASLLGVFKSLLHFL
jgi:hypothetical protein